MAAAPNGALADVLEDSLNDQLGLDNGGEPKPEAPKVEAPKTVSFDDFEAERSSNKGLKDKIGQLELTIAQFAGMLRERQDAAPKPVVEQPKPLEINYKEIGEKMAAAEPGDAAAIMADLIRQIVQHERGDIERTVDQRTQQHLGARDAMQRKTAGFQSEIGEIKKEYGDLWENQDFVKDADQEALRILSIRLNKPPNEITEREMLRFEPGDLDAAAARAYRRWSKEGKLPNETKPAETVRPSLREITRTVPRDNGLGNGNNHHAGPAKTIDEAFTDPDERRQAHVVFKKMSQDFPELTEERYVKRFQSQQVNASA